jgi:hyaluronate lyase
VNPYRLPGTTVDVRSRANASGEEYRGAYNWVGGASLGAYGVAAMQLDAWSSKLTAKKSWFMFDNEIVALGTGITSSDKRTIETVVENRKLTDTGDNAFLVNDEAKPATLPWSETMTNVSWAHLAGNVSGADIGYYFPQPATLKGLRETRTNSWFEINAKRGSTNLHARNYLTLWLDHGTNPVNATYSYVLLPNKTPDEMAYYAASPDIVVLENLPRAQAVRENRLNITAVNFWNDGAATVGDITVDKKAAVMTRATSSELEVAVSDPTQKNSSIKVEIAMAAAGTLSVDPGVTITALSPKVKLTVNVKSAGGRTFRARFQLPVVPAPALAARVEGRSPRVPILPNRIRNLWNSSVQERSRETDATPGAATASVELSLTPTLTVQRTDSDTLILSWSPAYIGYRLQSRTNIVNLGLDADWVDVPGGTNSPVIVPISKTNPGTFFQLKAP